mmetsp:Transcript_23817/g.51982  ORF Transcript_23817/g.51982 Transcript_23817/m.51982 type:complete len:314 (-) Transcript_23817:92-1033(-)|eukprot:CAMPEP_0206453800 /NCGR_PEP_ID=MMETSP0324_2-20121206/20761_1 /ASSEMBLY_ACC=CAM_ASM_000836 /TAXON_ID=2866 /ORGANISM="Crypthecodinium cohnii, Strain Seligo" /LENGTH=313 /DNA_ID=CAMNT_0053924159 /DNA_START=60 /DNA_END=1001 /DNA_ORIENTATION=-
MMPQGQSGYGGGYGNNAYYGQQDTQPYAGSGTPPSAFQTYPSQGYNVGSGGPPTASQTYGGGYGEANATMAAYAGNNHMSDVFFAASCCIITGSLLSAGYLLLEFNVVDLLQVLYLGGFGFVLAVLDTPWLRTIKAVMDAKTVVGKYMQFVTRVTFRGVTLIFLSSALFMTMWDNLKGGLYNFLAVVLCLFPTLVGFGSVVIGLLKSQKLDKARRQLQGDIEGCFNRFAVSSRGPTGGLTMDEFNMMTKNNGSFNFEKLDLKLIFNALISNPSWRGQLASTNQTQGGYSSVDHEFRLSKQDLVEWVNNGMVFL